MKKALMILACLGVCGFAVAGDFSDSPTHVPMRWDNLETNIPDDSTISFGTDQDITVSYNSTTDFVNVGGTVGVSSIIVGTGSKVMTGCLRYAGSKLFIFNGTDWDNLSIAQTPTPTPTVTPTAVPPTPTPTP